MSSMGNEVNPCKNFPSASTYAITQGKFTELLGEYDYFLLCLFLTKHLVNPSLLTILFGAPGLFLRLPKRRSGLRQGRQEVEVEMTLGTYQTPGKVVPPSPHLSIYYSLSSLLCTLGGGPQSHFHLCFFLGPSPSMVLRPLPSPWGKAPSFSHGAYS